MSTDYQKYSIENQAVVIAAFAQLHKLTIVRTYRDEGESGLQRQVRLCPLRPESGSKFRAFAAAENAFAG
jgi:hypothetical protein